MEDSSVTTTTLDIYRELRRRHDNVGIVIQSCLRRSSDDIAALLAEGPSDVRLCKGIYIEPEEIAYTDADDIRGSFDELLEQLFEGGARVGIATHDPLIVTSAERTIKRMAVTRDQYELVLFETRSFTSVATLANPLLTTISKLDFSSDGQRLLLVGTGSRAHVWDLGRLRERLTELGLNW